MVQLAHIYLRRRTLISQPASDRVGDNPKCEGVRAREAHRWHADAEQAINIGTCGLSPKHPIMPSTHGCSLAMYFLTPAGRAAAILPGINCTIQRLSVQHAQHCQDEVAAWHGNMPDG